MTALYLGLFAAVIGASIKAGMINPENLMAARVFYPSLIGLVLVQAYLFLSRPR